MLFHLHFLYLFIFSKICLNLTTFLPIFWLPGLSKPVLHLNKGVVSEGEELTARCMAPGETGSIFFYFYEDSKEILEKQVNSNQAEAKLRFSSIGIHKIHCAYIVLVTPGSFKSNQSNTITVSVKGKWLFDFSVCFKASDPSH